MFIIHPIEKVDLLYYVGSLEGMWQEKRSLWVALQWDTNP